MAVYFATFLVLVTFVTGIVWVLDKYRLAPLRQKKLQEAQAQCDEPLSEAAQAKLLAPSGIVDTSVQIFPVIAFVLILRSFIYEPFQIPSGSMMPTLLNGDFILVNKFNYGLRDPIARHKFWDGDLPEQGDVIVFKYPVNTEIDYIKRVMGVPGDHIFYRNKRLYIKSACKESDKVCPKSQLMEQTIVNVGEFKTEFGDMLRLTSVMPNKTHDILINPAIDADEQAKSFCAYAQGNICEQTGTAIDEFIVPEGYYFVMGDNRDNSLDGRFWGFVSEKHLVGEAVAIWMSFDFERTADDLLPSWIPTGVRFNRIGGIE